MGSASRSPAQLFALLLGAVLVAVGVIGFLYEPSFSAPEVEQDAVFGILAVNGWHNLVHLATGALGLAMAASYTGARAYALGLGAVYAVVALIGFLSGDAIFGLIAINTEDNVLHVLIAVAGIGAGLATPEAPAPTTVATR